MNIDVELKSPFAQDDDEMKESFLQETEEYFMNRVTITDGEIKMDNKIYTVDELRQQIIKEAEILLKEKKLLLDLNEILKEDPNFKDEVIESMFKILNRTVLIEKNNP